MVEWQAGRSKNIASASSSKTETSPLWKGQARRRFLRSPLLPLFFLVLLLTLLSGSLLLTAAIGQNRLAAENSQTELSSELVKMDARMREILIDNIWWDMATVSAFEKQDWYWIDENLGTWLLNAKGLYASYLLDGQDRVVFSAVDGQRVLSPTLEGFGDGLQPLIDEVRANKGLEPSLATGWYLYNGRVALIAVGDFTPEYEDDPPKVLSDASAPRPLLVIVCALEEPVIANLTASPLIPSLDVVSGEKSDMTYSQGFNYPQVQMPLFSNDGEEIGYMSWYPPRPGSELLQRIGWPLGGVLLIGVALLWMIVRRIQDAEKFKQAGASKVQALDETGQALEGSLRTVMQSIDNGIAVFDENRKLVLWNERFLRFTGYPREMVHPGTAADSLVRYLYSQENISAGELEEKVEEMMRPFNHPGRFSYDMVTPENRVVEVRQSRLPDGGLVRSYLDVTQRRQAEEELQISESRYRAVVDNQTEFICRRDSQGRFTFVNDAYCSFLGQRRSDLLGVRARQEIHPDDQAEVRRREKELGVECLAVTYKYRVKIKDRGWRWLEWSDKVLLSDSGEIEEIQSVGRDVTALNQAQEEALQLTKLASIGQVVAGVAHEITQPLNALAMAAENAMVACEAAQEDAQEYMYQKLEGIYGQAQRLHRIVEHLRQFNRKDQPARSSLELVSVVQQAVGLARRQVPLDGIELDVHVLDRTCPVQGWAFDLEQILLNLITNARDAIVERHHQETAQTEGKSINQLQPEFLENLSGRIVIEMEYQLPSGSHPPDGLRERRRKERTIKGQPTFVVRVKDNGIGLPQQAESTVFEPFFTTKAPGSGMGLGLALCHRKIQAMGGDIFARNDEEGAVFEILLPEQVALPEDEQPEDVVNTAAS
ncbi:PAS-domain containing protein [Rhodovibrionaceae bacterium A322]